ncbi:serine/threonine-protein kinase [Archangium lansingense]|uniref:Protein kinase n=1 Tax=Archangium lansingense TaxID=2995310 RepID=A0ABT3ZVR1_9BACT|nr:serine/threonine-protein kinase [Archangium lansinium]MCY1073441.1 protein kinase [Archangium lansinium]
MRCPTCHRRLTPATACPLDGPCAPETPLHQEETGAPSRAPKGYTLGELLGAGGAGQVYAAHREADGRTVALKLGGPGTRERFAREAEALRRLAAPDVPTFIEASEVEERPFLAMERLEGETLAAWMARQPGNGAVRREEALRLARQVGEVLGRVHAAGLVHRDLKPENVFLRTGGTVALLDFGLARHSEGAETLGLTQAGQRLGTVHYMAPEQFQDARYADARADVYALGVLLFELLTGRPPFVGEAPEVVRGHLSLRPPRPSSLTAIPPELEALLLRCLAKEPPARFTDGAALAQALREEEEVLARGEAHPAVHAPAAVPSAGPATSSLRRVALLGVGLRATARAVLERVSPEGGALGRLQGEGCIVTFHEHPSAAVGLRAAARAARGLLGAGLVHGAVLHVAELRVRPGRSGTRLAGAALEKPEGWWQAHTEPALYLTAEAAALLAPHEVLAASGSERFTLAEHATSSELDAASRQTPHPLVGREELLAELSATARQALTEQVPCLTLLEGEPGQGKSRLMAALTEALVTGPVRLLTLRAPAPDTTQEPLSVQLERALEALGAPPYPVPESGEAAARLGMRLRALARKQPLALLIDDAHQSDALCLDALERATLGGEPLPLWVCLAAPPELRTLRPHLGDRAARTTLHLVPPLPSSATRALLRELLHPVEFIAEPVLAHLESLTQGNPLALVELVRALRETGAVRPDARSATWVLAPDELPREAITTPFERVVHRVRSALPHTSRLLASLCAVLGESLSAEDVDAAQRALEGVEESQRELAALDAGMGLERLTRAGVLEAQGNGRYTFRHRLLRDALKADTPPSLLRTLHRAALHSMRARGIASPEATDIPMPRLRRLAEHAASCGEHDIASRAFLTLGERARAAHQDVEAERAYSAALAHLPEESHPLREQALGGRGRVRSRTQRFREAIEDLTAARALAEARGDDAAVVDLLLAEATLHDWLERPEDSQRAAEQAFLREERLTDERLRLRCALARGRNQAREGRWPEAVEVLAPAVAEAERLDDFESEAIGRLVLGVALTFLQRVDEAAVCLEAVISRGRARGDLLHVGTAHTNRVLLWLRQQSVEPALEDLAQAVRLARELGHVQLERWASFNFAEVLHWSGRGPEALPHARRAQALGERFFSDAPVALDAVLVARIAANLGESTLARESLAWVERRVPPERLAPVTRVQVRLVERLLARTGLPADLDELDGWQAILDEAMPVASDDEALEFLLRALDAALTAGEPSRARAWWDEARQRAASAPIWRPRLAALEPRLG